MVFNESFNISLCKFKTMDFFPSRVYGPILYPYLVTNWKLFWTSSGTFIIFLAIYIYIYIYIYVLYFIFIDEENDLLKRLVIHFIQIILFLINFIRIILFINSIIKRILLINSFYSVIPFIQRIIFIN